MTRSPSRNGLVKRSLPIIKSAADPLEEIIDKPMIAKRKAIFSANNDASIDRVLKMNANAKLQRRKLENRRINEENKALVRRIYDRKSNLNKG